ncbi:hypothetical protein H257_08894 [Aphanomyces astaci]|uniref:Chitin-binding type-4 domain-containing protein n=1 Tax=Aphanomyces astaci TaxID=112090 RepID=W4GET9_APHAT|nr:hypothetical protein H257_08894 [Aphanomyces astaci]ETV77483.1 hypothetical protein H257_08894 [Aphanomyces astaci]RQM27927.1 hypothetical protein B5M09_011653 [Aphanomyces astaci]|eukprot:XP_009833270.1 hypothetical protein H257_08894 [Aphanomyces astaci]
MRPSTFSLLSVVSVVVLAHSWLECTNYDLQGPTNHLYWNKSACAGLARCGARQAQEGFGVDTGFDFRPEVAKRTCQCAAAGAYDTPGARMATYTPGQKVCLAYPAKNHVADVCTNEYIPDTGVRIFRTQTWPSTAVNVTDPPLRQWPVEYAQANGAHVAGHVDYKGFQNCPKFCEDKGRALCTMCFQLEKDISPGKYTFQWQWMFNSINDVYGSCWEANVV